MTNKSGRTGWKPTLAPAIKSKRRESTSRARLNSLLRRIRELPLLGFRTLIACYYDAPDLSEVKAWMELARPIQGVRGFMYTPWEKNYRLLPAFGDGLQAERLK